MANNYQQYLNNPLFELVSSVSFKLQLRVYVIGGFVRDIFLDRHSTDIDFVVDGDGIALAKAVSEEIKGDSNINIFKNFGTAMLMYKEYQLEFVGARKESYSKDSRKPKIVSGTLCDDQNRRDFTINAMAISLNKDDYGTLIDPFNGISDIKIGLIRTPLDADITFSDDPLRMMRAIRFASQLNFCIDVDTFESIRRNADRIKIISSERISEEFNKILMSKKPSIGLKLLEKSTLLDYFFPQLTQMKGIKVQNGIAHKDNFYHTLEVVDHIAEKSDNLWLRWAALLHDIGKPSTQRFMPDIGWTFHGHEVKGAKMVSIIFNQMKLPMNNKLRYVKNLVLLHLRPIILSSEIVTDSAVRRLLFDAGDNIDDLMTLCEADITSKNEKKIKHYLNNFQLVRQKLIEIEEKDRLRNWQPPITGEIIMKTFGIPPSKDVGTIKSAIREAILEGELENNYEKVFEFMINFAQKMGLNRKV